MNTVGILEEFRDKVRALTVEHGLSDTAVTVVAKPLTPGRRHRHEQLRAPLQIPHRHRPVACATSR